MTVTELKNSRLEVRSLRKQYGNKLAVENVSLKVNSREIVGLLGPNGAGKTTCFYMIVGLLRADAGDIYLDERRLTQAAMHARARAGIGYLPQEASVFRKLSTENNLRAILELRPARNTSWRARRLLREELLEQLLNEFNLQGVRKSLAWHANRRNNRRTTWTESFLAGRMSF